MGFSPEIVGLAGERITGKFREPRPNGCPHKGLDISCSHKPMVFKAGVFGIIVEPQGGPWGTLTISPFQAPDTLIQYLHTSRIAYSEGWAVAPWTEVGSTGNTSPVPNTPYHLHVQVQEKGEGSEECWQKRNFVDPEAWTIQNTLLAYWTYSDQIQQDNLTIYRNSVYRITGTDIGSKVEHIFAINVHRADGCAWFLNTTCEGRVVDRSDFGIRVQFDAGPDANSCVCGQCMKYQAPAHHTTLAQISVNTLSDGDGTIHKKGGAPLLEQGHCHNPAATSLDTFAQNTFVINVASKSIISILWAVRAQLNDISLETYYGVLKNEKF